MANVKLTDSQRQELNRLWFIYGNKGKKSTLGNHRFIQGILARGEDNRELYLNGIQNMKYKGIYTPDKAITWECIDAVDKIINNDN